MVADQQNSEIQEHNLAFHHLDLSVCVTQDILQLHTRGGHTPILGHIRDVRPEWVSFPGQKPADRCKLLTKNLRMI